jgi:hypothetical protein
VVFYSVVGVAVIAFGIWFVRTPLFRAHLRGRGADPGEQGTRMEGKYGGLGGTYNRMEKPR